VLALAFTLFKPPPTQGPFGRDFEAYYAAGATWNAGGDPWSRDVWRVERTVDAVDASRDELLPYVGPAAALPLYGALARLPFGVAVRVWTALLLAALAALVLCALALARARGLPAACGAALFAFVSGPGVSDLALGQVALVSAAGIAGALVAYERRALAPGAFATLLAGLQPNLALALLARMRDRAALLAASLGALAFAALTLWAGGGARGFAEYLHRLREHGRAEGLVTIQHTPAAIAYAFGAPEIVATAVGIALALAAAATAAIVTLRARLGARDGALLALAALPFAVPFFHEHDFVVELIPLIVLAVVSQGRARVFAGVAAALICVNWLDLAQRPSAAAQIVALALALSCAFAVLGRGEGVTRADLAPFVAALALACVAVPLARAFPAPVWPDALPTGYRAPAAADASAVWAAEQHAAGLDARQPVWGMLRALPLAGCIVLGAALTATARRRR
jgi:Glycosyltransferase family 87